MEELKEKIDENTALHLDYDQIAFQSASVTEKHTIKATHKASGRSMDFDNVTSFWGRGKNIGGWLSDTNTKRAEAGAKQFSKEDFTVEDVYINEPVANATQAAKTRVKGLSKYLDIDNYCGVLGESGTFRHKLELPQTYKGQRSEHKPLHLQDVRSYLVKHHKGEVIQDIEADDALTMKQFLGWRNYKSTGKITDIVGSIDKDSLSTPGYLFNFNKAGDGSLQYPEVIVIDDSIGNIWVNEKGKSKNVKGWGSYWLAYQLLIGDSTDNIRPYQDMNIKYGEQTFYKEAVDIKNQAELFTFVKDKYHSWFPSGVSFTSWTGKDIEISTDEWLETIWKLVYMQRIPNDPTTFAKMLQHYQSKA